jgi:hypothetical protein
MMAKAKGGYSVWGVTCKLVDKDDIETRLEFLNAKEKWL